jgi:hypothetical protein
MANEASNNGDPGSVQLTEVLKQNQIIGGGSTADGMPFAVATARTRALDEMTTASAMRELAYASPSPWTSWLRQEHVPELRDRMGLRTYYRMKRADGTVRGSLRRLKTPVLSARWFVEPADPENVRAVNVAKFVEDNLFNRLNTSWKVVLNDILLMVDYGYFLLEKVWEMGDDGKLRWKKLAPRHPIDVMDWVFDVNGGPNGVVMDPPPNASTIVVQDAFGLMSNTMRADNGPIPIPIEKLLAFSFEPEAGDLTGTPILRSAYQHYYYKYNLYKIDAIQKERHGTGIPIIILPLGYTDNDKKAADELGRNIRTNERAHVVLPPGWTLEFAKMPTQPVDPMKSIEHHDRQIEKTMMVPQGEKDDEQNTFFKSTRSIAEMICDTINRHAIPELVDANFSRVGGEYPQLRARRIGEFDDARTQSFAVRNYVGAGVIIPDEPLEKQVRIDLDLPAPDPTTARGVPTRTSGTSLPEEQAPGAPSTADVLGQPGDGAVQGKPAPANKPLISNITPGAKVGPTRQQPLPPVGTPKGNAGLDRSGG